jgi:hypothetical protein
MASAANVERTDEAKAIEALVAPIPPRRRQLKRSRNHPTASQLARLQAFRLLTVVATWALILAIFAYDPKWIQDWLQLIAHSIESLAAELPEPWGPELKTMLRELGASFWLLIATAIVLLRLVVWLPFHIWRLRRSRRAGHWTA